MGKFINFLKYNNATVLILLAFFIIGSGVFAQTETGQDFIGQQNANVQGIDNTLLLAVDLDNYNMDFKIEKIEEDSDYYYVTYTFLDIDILNKAWQYELKEKVRKVSKKSGKELSSYMAEEFKEIYDTRIRELKDEQVKAQSTGEEKRVEVTSYDGLIGKTLDLAGKIFPGYEPIKTAELSSPENFNLPSQEQTQTVVSPADNLTNVYQEYMNEHDQDGDKILDTLDNCPSVSNPDQADSDQNGVGDLCENTTAPATESPDTTVTNKTTEEQPAAEQMIEQNTEQVTEPENVEIIDLPSENTETPVTEPASNPE